MSLDSKKEIIHAILTDDLNRARELTAVGPETLELLSDLLAKAEALPPPLNTLTSSSPEFVVIYPSYTCGVGCRMCTAGFADRTHLYDDYFYLRPDQFEKFLPWIRSASHVLFVGMGETLESPYLSGFLKQITEKESVVYSSGVPLNREKTRSLIESKLKVLTLSFDGNSSIGHGNGQESFIKKFWEKVRTVQKTKQELNSHFPTLTLAVTVNNENLNHLEEIIQTASQHGINEVMITPMTFLNDEIFSRTIFTNFETARKKINSIMSQWNKKGMRVTHMGFRKSLANSVRKCPYLDNWLGFTGTDDAFICEGPLNIPQVVQNFSRGPHWNSFPLRYLRYLHFGSETTARPMACQQCFITKLQNFSQSCSFTENNPQRQEDFSKAVNRYQTASRLKRENRFEEAKKIFLEVLETTHDAPVKGNAYFHLGEMELRLKNYPKALSYLKLAVQWNFRHEMAFAYLYLLLMILGTRDPVNRRKKFNLAEWVTAKQN